MKFRNMLCVAAIASVIALAIPVQLAAQDKKDHQHMFHHYHLVDLGSTFGGPRSYLNPGSGNDFNPFASDLNSGGTVAGFAETSASDPFPNFVFWNGLVTHAFRARRGGVLTDLGALPGGGSSAPLWISANGLIAGVSENGAIDPLYAGLPEVRAVFWQHGKITDLGTLPEGGYESEANAVNSSGQVVGSALNTVPDPNSMALGTFWLWGVPYGYQTRAFIWEKGVMKDLGTLPGGTDAQGILINERGQVLGYSYTSSAPSAFCAAQYKFSLTTGSFVWDKNNGMADLHGLGGTCTLANDINNRGQVVGQSAVTGDAFAHAFLWEDGSIHDLGGSLGGDFTGAFVINDEGEAVGYAYFPGNTVFHATLWKRVGEMTDLGVLGGDPCSYATGINAKGQVVGASQSSCDHLVATFRSFLWEDGSIVDLNALIPLGSGLHLGQTFTINDRGEIAGTGSDSSENDHAFLLIPCDEHHPSVDGCDYSLVDSVALPQSASLRNLPSQTHGVFWAWPTPDSTLPLRSGSWIRHGMATPP
jgi:probable HAF family extracellular repeat protein